MTDQAILDKIIATKGVSCTVFKVFIRSDCDSCDLFYICNNPIEKNYGRIIEARYKRALALTSEEHLLELLL